MAERSKNAGADPDDATLVRRFQSGEDVIGAFELLFERYSPMTYAFFCRGSGDARLAEELNQDLYLGIIEGLPRFRGESSFKTWLFRLAYHHLSNLRRRLRTHVDEQPVDPPCELWEQLIPAPEESPDVRLGNEELLADLRRCLARLPELQRAVVFDHYFRGRSLRELTQELGLDNASGARKHLIAAQRKLKHCMKAVPKTDVRRSARRRVRHLER